MAADSAADDSVGTGKNVHIEIGIYLKCGKHDEIELIDRCIGQMACIVNGADLVMEMIVLE